VLIIDCIIPELNLQNIDEKIEFFEENQNIEHDFDFNEKFPLFYQITNDETKRFLTYLFIKYINTNKLDAEYCKNTVIEIMKNEASE